MNWHLFLGMAGLGVVLVSGCTPPVHNIPTGTPTPMPASTATITPALLPDLSDSEATRQAILSIVDQQRATGQKCTLQDIETMQAIITALEEHNGALRMLQAIFARHPQADSQEAQAAIEQLNAHLQASAMLRQAYELDVRICAEQLNQSNPNN